MLGPDICSYAALIHWHPTTRLPQALPQLSWPETPSGHSPEPQVHNVPTPTRHTLLCYFRKQHHQLSPQTPKLGSHCPRPSRPHPCPSILPAVGPLPATSTTAALTQVLAFTLTASLPLSRPPCRQGHLCKMPTR